MWFLHDKWIINRLNISSTRRTRGKSAILANRLKVFSLRIIIVHHWNFSEWMQANSFISPVSSLYHSLVHIHESRLLDDWIRLTESMKIPCPIQVFTIHIHFISNSNQIKSSISFSTFKMFPDISNSSILSVLLISFWKCSEYPDKIISMFANVSASQTVFLQFLNCSDPEN
jgi:hypothetical protein